LQQTTGILAAAGRVPEKGMIMKPYVLPDLDYDLGALEPY